MTVLDALRRPEYTGERRCTPCTVINAGVVLALAAVTGYAWLPGGVAVAVLGGALLAVRGYVVPFTPRFAPAIAARLPFEFGHGESSAESGSLGGDPDPESVLSALSRADVIEGGEELALTEAFQAAWEDRMEALRSLDADAIADATASAAPWDATGEVVENRVRVRGDGRDVWLLRPVAIADTAAIEALVATGVPNDVAAAAAAPLRMFLRTCPACGGPATETTRDHCCGGTAGYVHGTATTVLACQECEVELYEFGPADDERV